MNQYNDKRKKHGYWEVYYSYSESIYTKGNYINGLKDGYLEEYYSDGTMACKGNYKNDQHYGYWEQYPRTNALLPPENQFILRKIFIL
jgi:antitoxin component YwqK of YwqJK toxin-antitoxin module